MRGESWPGRQDLISIISNNSASVRDLENDDGRFCPLISLVIITNICSAIAGGSHHPVSDKSNTV